MIQEDRQWVKDNMLLLTTSRRYQPGELEMIFAIYNRITGQNKKVTGCGRCVDTTKKTVLHYYDKNRD
jgi:hypothetical protein